MKIKFSLFSNKPTKWWEIKSSIHHDKIENIEYEVVPEKLFEVIKHDLYSNISSELARQLINNDEFMYKFNQIILNDQNLNNVLTDAVKQSVSRNISKLFRV